MRVSPHYNERELNFLSHRWKEAKHGLLQMCLFMLGDPNIVNRGKAFDLLLTFAGMWESPEVGRLPLSYPRLQILGSSLFSLCISVLLKASCDPCM